MCLVTQSDIKNSWKFWSLVEAAESFGVQVRVESSPAPQGTSRHLGTLEDDTVVIFGGDFMACWFTLGHLVGHLMQRTRPTPEMFQAIEVVNPYRAPGPMTDMEESLLLSHEREAAEIGLSLILRTLNSGVTGEDLEYYSKMFWADYHYLRNFIITGEGGSDVFDRFFEGEKGFENLSPNDGLVDLRVYPPSPLARKIVVV